MIPFIFSILSLFTLPSAIVFEGLAVLLGLVCCIYLIAKLLDFGCFHIVIETVIEEIFRSIF